MPTSIEDDSSDPLFEPLLGAMQRALTGRARLQCSTTSQEKMYPHGPMTLYWEDFTPGWSYQSPARSLGAEAIKRFAQEYDPQPYHTDEEAAKATPFGGLIASGWQTCGVMMRLMCDGYLLDSACIGSPGLEELRWLKPVRPGDALHMAALVLDQTPSASRPSRGTVTFRWDVRNQRDEVVCTMVGRQHFLRRVPATATGA